MIINLPKTGYEVTLKEFVSQDLHEKIEQYGADALGMNLGDAQAARHATVEQIGEQLGMDKMMEIQNAENDEQREVLLAEARNMLIASKLSMSGSLTGAHKIDRVRTAGMIEKITKGGERLEPEDMEVWVGGLPHSDYTILSGAVEKFVDEQNEELGKPSAQSEES